MLAAGNRRKEGHFISGIHERGRLRNLVVHCHAQGLLRGKRLLPCTATSHEHVAQPGDGRGRQLKLLLLRTDLLPQTREVKHLHSHRYNSEYGMNVTVSPTRTEWFGGLSTRPSAHAVDVSTAESCVG